MGSTASNLEFTNDWHRRAEPVWSKLLPQLKPKKILEIGSYEGASICMLIRLLDKLQPDIEIHAVDTWEGGIEHQSDGFVAADMSKVESRFIKNMEIIKRESRCRINLQVHKTKSIRALAKMISDGKTNYFDFIYIDGSHQAADVITDAVLAFDLLRENGIIVFDDYLWREPTIESPLRSPKIAIDSFTTIFSNKLKIVSAPLYQLYIQKLSR